MTHGFHSARQTVTSHRGRWQDSGGAKLNFCCLLAPTDIDPSTAGQEFGTQHAYGSETGSTLTQVVVGEVEKLQRGVVAERCRQLRCTLGSDTVVAHVELREGWAHTNCSRQELGACSVRALKVVL